jgi:hypothetical protein
MTVPYVHILTFHTGGTVIHTLIRGWLYIRVQPYPYEGTIVTLQGNGCIPMKIQPYPYYYEDTAVPS